MHTYLVTLQSHKPQAAKEHDLCGSWPCEGETRVHLYANIPKYLGNYGVSRPKMLKRVPAGLVL